MSQTATPDAPSTPFHVRAPWPDEIPRLRSLFQLGALPAAAHVRILVADAPERIVGGFLIVTPRMEGKPGVLLLRIRPAYHGSTLHAGLLANACSVAREAGLPALTTTLAAGTSDEAFFRQHGARFVKADHFYCGDLLVAHRRLKPLAQRHAGSIAMTVRPLAPEDHAVVAAMAASHGLLNVARAERTLRTDYDSEMSLVCVEAGLVVGALLAKAQSRGNIYVEIRMVHPDHTRRSGIINLLLITTACEHWLAAGFLRFSLSAQPEKDRETVNFASRMQCQLTGEQHVLRWELTASE